MSLSEPPLKKMKIDLCSPIWKTIDSYAQSIGNTRKPLVIVANKDLYNPVPLVKAFVGHIKDPTNISRTVLALNEKIPLKELQHLKRVRKRDIILCAAHLLNNTSTIQDYLEEHIPELQNVFEYFKEVLVPGIAPKVISQYKEANKIWSVIFHPNQYLESIVGNTVFNDHQLSTHRNLMGLTFDIAKWYIEHSNLVIDEDMFKELNVALVLDPIDDSIVAIGCDNKWSHPMQHATMIAIDNVAKTQNAGAWGLEELPSDRKLSGINKHLYLYLSEKFPNFKYGARPFITKSEKCEDSNGPYLCTGYYIYLLREPCVMCAMALVHSRISRTFFCFENKLCGALKSQTKLHLNPSLNHRFEVFTGFI